MTNNLKTAVVDDVLRKGCTHGSAERKRGSKRVKQLQSSENKDEVTSRSARLPNIHVNAMENSRKGKSRDKSQLLS